MGSKNHHLALKCILHENIEINNQSIFEPILNRYFYVALKDLAV